MNIALSLRARQGVAIHILSVIVSHSVAWQSSRERTGAWRTSPGLPYASAGLPRRDFVPPRNDRIKNAACVQSNTANSNRFLLPEVVEGLDLGVAEDAVVDAIVVQQTLEVTWSRIDGRTDDRP